MDRLFFDDKWAEQVYHVLSGLTLEQKSRLTAKELYKIRTDHATKQFAINATIEQQMLLLTKVGYDWFFGLYPSGKELPELMRKAYRQHTIKDTRVEVMQEMIEGHVFIIDNKAVAIGLAMMAMNSHSDVFVINTEFLKVPKLLQQFESTKNPLAKLLRENNPNNASAEFRDGLRALDAFNEIVGEVFRAEKYIESVLGLTKLDFWILHFLLRHRNNYVSIDYLKRHLAPEYQSKAIAFRCSALMKRNLIDKLPKTTTANYTIKAAGILILGETMNMIINRASKA